MHVARLSVRACRPRCSVSTVRTYAAYGVRLGRDPVAVRHLRLAPQVLPGRERGDGGGRERAIGRLVPGRVHCVFCGLCRNGHARAVRAVLPLVGARMGRGALAVRVRHDRLAPQVLPDRNTRNGGRPSAGGGCRTGCAYGISHARGLHRHARAVRPVLAVTPGLHLHDGEHRRKFRLPALRGRDSHRSVILAHRCDCHRARRRAHAASAAAERALERPSRVHFRAIPHLRVRGRVAASYVAVSIAGHLPRIVVQVKIVMPRTRGVLHSLIRLVRRIVRSFLGRGGNRIEDGLPRIVVGRYVRVVTAHRDIFR